jgi:hypothetical protein
MEASTAAPLGAEVVTPAADSTPAPDSSANSTPTPIKLSPDSMVEGPDGKPVKYSDYLNGHVRGFQAQATKASQRAAELERKLAESDAARQRYEAAQRQATRPGAGNAQADPFAELRSLPYLSGEDAARVVGSIANEINVRDQVLIATLKQLQAIQKVVQPLYQTSATSAFDSKIAGWIKAGGYPEEYTDLAKELYLGYEPSDELDQEFPRILAERIQQVTSAHERLRKANADAARRLPFVPGRGGNAGPSKPLALKPSNSAAEDAAALWEALQADQRT